MSGVSTDLMIRERSLEVGEMGLHAYTRFQGYIIDFIRETSIYSMPVWTNELINISPFHTVPWPKHLVKPILAVLQRDNKRFLLSVSNDLFDALPDLPDTNDNECNAEDLYRLDGMIDVFGWSIWNWGLGELYGAGTILPPFGKIVNDYNKRQSYIKGVKLKTGDQVWLFFKSNGLKNCPKYIPDEAKDCCEFYMLMKYFRIKDQNLSDVMDAKYKERLYRLEEFHNDATEDEWIRAVNGNTISAPKIT